MNIKINGENFSTDKEPLTVIELLKDKNVANPETVAVQLNGRLVRRTNFNSTAVEVNDEVDFLFMMSGGSF